MPENETAVKQTPICTQKRKVEVTVQDDKVVIRMSTYADGIGWFTQKTITVDADMLDELQSMLSEARGKARRESDDILSAEMLEF